MTDKENNPDHFGKSDVTAMQCQDDWAVPPPEFHCPVCEGTGFLQTGHDWSPQACIDCNSDTG